MNLLLATGLLAISLFTSPVRVLVLSSGHQVPVSDVLSITGQTIVFRHANGSLYSLPLSQIELAKTNDLNDRLANAKPAVDDGIRHLKVSEDEKRRLLAELANSHAPRSERKQTEPAALSASTLPAAAPASETVNVDQRADEWYWRNESRRLEENVRQAQENLQLLVDREQSLQDEIIGLMNLGYKPDQFSLKSWKLETTRDQIPRAQLDVERAERALAQFRDDARRQGVLPGWLR